MKRFKIREGGQNKVSCHFCNSSLVLVPPRSSSSFAAGQSTAAGTEFNFTCSVCGCSNVRDEDGELVAPDAALTRDPNHPKNKESFSKRASSSTSHLPPTFSTSPFCRTCRSNQSLQLHLLASFPSADDNTPSSPSKQESFILPHEFEEYRASLDSRYPLLCSTCEQAVNEIIKERDYKARAAALGWRLKVSKGEEGKKEVKRKKEEGMWAWRIEGWVWKLRGALWWCSWAVWFGITLLVALLPTYFLKSSLPTRVASRFLLFNTLSILWTFWNPTFDTVRRARARGKNPDVRLVKPFVYTQGLTFTVRLALSLLLKLSYYQTITSGNLRRLALGSFAYSSLALLISLKTIHIRETPPIRLAAPSSPIRPSLPSTPHDPLSPLASLSLSSFAPSPPPTPSSSFSLLRTRKPPPPPSNPTLSTTDTPSFGVPSLPGVARSTPEPTFYEEENSMDWEPTPLPTSAKKESSIQLGPQRFFPPVKPSGLEGIFEERLMIDERVERRKESGRVRWWKKWF